MTRLGALAELDLDHLDLRLCRDSGKGLRIEGPVQGAAAEIARPDLPNDVAAILAMVRREAALARIMGEAALGGAFVECAHGVGAERAETHRGNIEDRDRIRLGAIGTADGNPKMLRIVHRLRRHRMTQPFVTLSVDVELRAERPLVELQLGALIDDRAFVAAERQSVLFAFEEILAQLRADIFEKKTDMGGDRIIAQHRMAGLDEVTKAEER